MALMTVLRTLAEQRGVSDSDFEISVSTYVQAGTLTPDERQALVSMTTDERIRWLASSRYPTDAWRAVILDFDAHGFIAAAGIVRWAEDLPAGG